MTYVDFIAVLGRIRYITETNFEDSGEMANAIDRIHDIADEAIETWKPSPTIISPD